MGGELFLFFAEEGALCWFEGGDFGSWMNQADI